MDYRGYRATVTFDDELDIFHGSVIGTNSVISFEGDSVEALREAFAAAVDEYLAFCEEEGVAPDKPFSGNVALRMSPDLHRAATVTAQIEGKSLNAWLTERVAEAVGLPGAELPSH